MQPKPALGTNSRDPVASRSSQPAAPPKPPRGGLALPIAPPRIRPSRMGRRRAFVLIAVHVLVAVHVAHWLSSGSTMSPLEPSEAMEFSKHRIVNAGLIFFALSIVSTVVLGRWFCGWACHLVALQDLARWLLGKLGIRPKPLRAGILSVVPLLAFLYMFVAPFVYHALGEDRPTQGILFAVTKDDFWVTFPSWIPALLTLLVCGFLIIYLLGSKGFCTFGCPYGGIYGVVDQLAPLRVRVTDDCTGTSHCTAVCTSNVRVNEEVRDFRMVVDPGCMKCMDCVSVCPNDALYMGLGIPALLARPVTAKPKAHSKRVPRPNRAAGKPSWARRALLGGFAFGALFVFLGFDRAYAWTANDLFVGAALTAAALALARVFGGKSTRRNDYGVIEEALLAVFFLAAMLVFRGLYGMVAFLFSLGLAAIVAYLLLQAGLLLWRANLTVHRWRLKRHGRPLPAAYPFALLILALIAFAAHSGVVQYHGFRVKQLASTIEQLKHERVDSHGGNAPESADRLSVKELRREIAQTADLAIAHLRVVERWTLMPSAEQAGLRASLHFEAGRPERFEAALRAAFERFPADATLRFKLAAYLASRARPEDALELLRECIRLDPALIDAYTNTAALLSGLGRLDEAKATLERALLGHPNEPMLLHSFGDLHLQRGELEAAAQRYAQAVEADPQLPERRLAYAGVLGQMGRWRECIEQLDVAHSQRPQDPAIWFNLSLAWLQIGDAVQAKSLIRRAIEAAPESPETHMAAARFYQTAGDTATAQQHFSTARRLLEEARGPR